MAAFPEYLLDQPSDVIAFSSRGNVDISQYVASDVRSLDVTLLRRCLVLICVERQYVEKVV